jgi:hypothetical protein
MSFDNKPSCLDAAYERLAMSQGLVDKPVFPENQGQPSPVKNNKPHITNIVVHDFLFRKEQGIKKYGTALQPFNGRSALQDAYEEVLDLAQYLRQKR